MEWGAQYCEFYHLKLQVKQKFMNVITFKSVSKKKWRHWFSCQSMFVPWKFFLVLANFLQNIVSLLELNFFPFNRTLNTLNSFVENAIHVKSKEWALRQDLLIFWQSRYCNFLLSVYTGLIESHVCVKRWCHYYPKLWLLRMPFFFLSFMKVNQTFDIKQ